MGTLRRWSFDGLTEGQTPNAAALKSDTGTAASAVAGQRTATATNAHHGMCVRTNATAFTTLRFPFAAGSTQVSASVYLYTAATPANSVTVLGFQTSSDTQIAPVTLGVDDKITANSGAVQGSALVQHGQLNRFDLVLDTVAGTLTVRVHAGNSTTPYSTLTWTGASFASASITGFNVGSLNGATWDGYWDSVQIEEARTSFLGPWIEITQLGTPTVTISDVDHDLGEATVSWPAVVGAASYDLYWAAGTSPSQGSFVLKQAGVTSPHRVTELTDGGQSLGIMAKA